MVAEIKPFLDPEFFKMMQLMGPYNDKVKLEYHIISFSKLEMLIHQKVLKKKCPCRFLFLNSQKHFTICYGDQGKFLILTNIFIY